MLNILGSNIKIDKQFECVMSNFTFLFLKLIHFYLYLIHGLKLRFSDVSLEVVKEYLNVLHLKYNYRVDVHVERNFHKIYTNVHTTLVTWK